MKTSELTGVALDWAVAKCEGLKDTDYMRSHMDAWQYSTDWAQGGPIIEREKIAVSPCSIVHPDAPWVANSAMGNVTILGPTPLIAAMRCYCCAKLGDEIDIPEELCQQQNS